MCAVAEEGTHTFRVDNSHRENKFATARTELTEGQSQTKNKGTKYQKKKN